MAIIKNYNIVKKLGETRSSVVYRCRKEKSETNVVIKILKIQYPTMAEIARFRQEYRIIKSIDLEGVIKTFDIIEKDGKIALVLEDFDGVSIKSILDERKRFDIPSFIDIALKTAKTLGELHQKDIIHLDIKPHNLLINPKDRRVKITDFGISTSLTHSNDEIYHPDVIQGTLYYISPEQTGRMNRIVDYRTDLYSLGVTFYEILTGTVPFKSEHPLEIIHSHIAKEPVPPEQLAPSIPAMISQIVMKLMAKNAEDRYQNALGLLADLEKCREQLKKNGKIEFFELATKDISESFLIPRKLYGREKELAALMSTFKRINEIPLSGSNEQTTGIMLVTGSPGVGKSALIKEINKPVTEKQGYFILGKYEQFRKDKPYGAIIQAFQKLLREILSESEERIGWWKSALEKALGANCKVITKLLPELEIITGPQPEIPELAGNEARNRFNLAFEAFIAVFAQQIHPLVLFLDDLQWADSASLQLIKYLIEGRRIKYLMLIGSYRDNEVTGNHPLAVTLADIEQAGIPVEKIALKELNEDHIAALIMDLLKCTKEKAHSLSGLINKKTGGNAFFVNEFLHTLYNKHLIKPDTRLGWTWDLADINRMQITSNVVEHLAEKISKLPGDVLDVLKVCACIGNRFDLEILSYLLDKPIDEVLNILTKAMKEGYIGMRDDLYIFHHDRIHEAAYSLISDDRKPEFHYKIGKLILKKEELNEKKLFYVTDQLNWGKKLIKDQEERNELARLNYRCGMKARTSAAYAPTLKYSKIAMTLLDENPWETQYDFCLSLYTIATEAAYLLGEYDTMEEYAAIVIKNAKNITDTIPIYENKIRAANTLTHFQKAVDIGREVLRKAGFPIPTKPSGLQLAITYIKAKKALKAKNIGSLIDLPEMKDPYIKSIFTIFALLGRSSYFISRKLFAYIIFKEAILSLKYGHCSAQSANYAGFAIIMCNNFGDYETGYSLGKLALSLGEKLQDRKYESSRIFFHYGFVAHWKEPMTSVRDGLRKGYLSGLETGSLEYLCYNLSLYDSVRLMLGMNLEVLEREMAENYNLIKQYKHLPSMGIQSIFLQMVRNLLGKSQSPTDLKGTAIDDREKIAEWKATNNGNLLANMFCYRLIVRYLLEDFKGGLEDCESIIPYIADIEGIMSIREVTFFSTLIKLACFPGAPQKKQKEYKKDILHAVKKFETWTRLAPFNNEHRLLILQAEEARVSHRYIQAEELYEKALELSRKNGFPIEEALVNELAGKCYLERGKKQLGAFYVSNAYMYYTRWGAKAKSDQLQQKYSDLMLHTKTAIRGGTSGTTSGTGTMFDLSTALKASQIISGEIVLGKLLSSMLKIVMENAGAGKGVVLLKQQEKLMVEAIVEEDKSLILQSIPANECRTIPASIINYVARTKKMVLLNDAVSEGAFTNDPYVKKNKLRSVLCTAILNQGRFSGILHLENNLSTGAFTKERLEILKVLSSQIAISIDNARLYANLEEKVKERTAELSESNNQLKAARDALWGEMELAKKIQTSLLPVAPAIEGYDIAAYMATAASVGGDYYDVINVDGRNWVIIGDVSGHGVPAGLMMMMVQTSIHNTLVPYPDILPSDMLSRVNLTITANNKRLGEFKYMTITVFAVEVDGKITFAGRHLDLAVFRAGSGKIEMIKTTGMWIGMLDDIKHTLEDNSFQLGPGDALLLYTDGITEAQKKGEIERNMFSDERLIDTFCKLGNRQAKDILTGILDDYKNDYEADDDITLLIIKKNSNDSAP